MRQSEENTLTDISPIGSDTSWPPSSQVTDFAVFEAMLREHPELANGPGSPAWRINGEMAMVLGWGRAILMQIAHPAVGEGVAAHSHFATSAGAKIQRFQQTLNRMLEMTFGTPQQAWQAGHKIDAIHGRVNGEVSPGHQPYSARQPELLKWVSATFTDSMLRVYDLFVEPLSLADKDLYVRQTSIAAPLLGAPLNYFPGSYAELQDYINGMLKSGTLVVGPQTREVADYVITGLPIPALAPLNWYGRLPVKGLLPVSLRELYGFKWSSLDASLLKSSAWTYRKIRPTLPLRLRRWPIAIEAERNWPHL